LALVGCVLGEEKKTGVEHRPVNAGEVQGLIFGTPILRQGRKSTKVHGGTLVRFTSHVVGKAVPLGGM